MLKRIVPAVLAVLYIEIAAISAAAFENANLLEYYSTDNTVTLYVNGISDGAVSCRIAGQECTANLSGGIYSDSEKYKTLFLIDSSTSMRHYNEKISAFLLECIDKKPQNEHYSIAVFSGNSYSNIIDFNADRYELEKAVGNIKYDAQSSYIYDNVDKAVKNLVSDEDKCYERIVLFTDGCENSATGINIEELINTINSSPVQIYTVTFVNSKKDNYEQLKNVARIARSSNATDIQVNENTEIKNLANTLYNDTISISSIIVSDLDSSVADGSRRPIEIVSGNITVKSEIITPMISPVSTSETVTETETVTAVETKFTSKVTESNPPSESKLEVNYILIISIIAAVIAFIVIIVVLFIMRKNKSAPITDVPSPIPAAENDDTMVLSSSGDTEMFFDNDKTASVIILRDIASTDHTFEAPLSGEVIIGRSSDLSSLVIDYDKSVSKRHCKIFVMGNEVFIEDLGSANKTFVNDIQISSAHVIRNADEIKIGRVKFKVTIR